MKRIATRPLGPSANHVPSGCWTIEDSLSPDAYRENEAGNQIASKTSFQVLLIETLTI